MGKFFVHTSLYYKVLLGTLPCPTLEFPCSYGDKGLDPAGFSNDVLHTVILCSHYTEACVK